MTLRNKARTYIILLHLSLFSVAVYFYQELELYLFLIEFLIVVSLFIGLKLILDMLEPFEFIQSFSDILKQADYSARFSPVGQPEMDHLISLYNQMLTHLYSERLRLGEQRGILEKLLDASPAAVIIFDFDERIALVNPSAEQLLDEEQSKLLGLSLKNIKHPLSQKMIELEVDQSELLTLPNGDRVRVQKATFTDRGFKRLFILIEELTQEVEQSEKSAYDKLIRIMSHEVNNTIAATNSLLNSCLHFKDQLNEDDRQDFENALNVVIKRNESLNLFMQEYASIIRLPEPDKTDILLIPFIERLFALFKPQLNERNIQFQINSEANKDLKIFADPTLLEQAMVNILKNAMEAVSTEGSILCQVSEHSSEIILEIIDSGTGIPPDILTKLFTPFYTTKEDGQGLGLMLIREILRAHQFNYQLTNCQNQGACFRVIIPSRR